jgi:hypothetical protein
METFVIEGLKIPSKKVKTLPHFLQQ